MEQQSRKKELIAALVVLLVVAGIVTAVVLKNKKSDTNASKDDSAATTLAESTDADTKTPASEPTTDTTATESASTNTSGFKDGTYTATGNYSTPEDTESITVKVTLKDGNIIDTTATASMKTEEAKEYAGQFIASYKPLVVGKNISSIKLSRVSGSSLTSQGFNRAIDEIETQAKS